MKDETEPTDIAAGLSRILRTYMDLAYRSAWARCHAFMSNNYEPGDELREQISAAADTHFREFWQEFKQ